MIRLTCLPRVAFTAWLGLPALALAHTGGGAAAHQGWLDGLVHPFTGLDHLLAMLAIAVWSALTLPRRRDAVAVPLAFALAVLGGALAAGAGWVPPAVEPMIAASVLVLGLLVATRAAWGTASGVLLAALFALFHGAAHGQELAGAGALAGMVLGTAVLHGAGLLLGARLRTLPHSVSRGLGAGVAVVGLAMLAT